MTRRRTTAAAVVLAAAILAANGASAHGLDDLVGTWMGEVTGTVIMSDALEVEIELHGDQVQGRWHMPMPPDLAVLFPGVDELGGEISGGEGTPPILTLETDGIEGCDVDVTVETMDSDRWGGPWHLRDCLIQDEGTLMVMRAAPVPALPLVGVLVLAAVLARRGWRGLQGRR